MKYALDSLVKVAAEPTHYSAKPYKVVPYGKEPAKLKPEDQKLLRQGVLRNEGMPNGVPDEKPTIYGLHDTSDAVRPANKQGPPEAQAVGSPDKLPALGNYQRNFNKELADEAGAAGKLSNVGYQAGLKAVSDAHNTGLGRQTAEAKSLVTPENVTIAGLNDTSDAVRPVTKQGPVAANDVPAKFGIPADKLGVDPTKLPPYADMANKARNADFDSRQNIRVQDLENKSNLAKQTAEAAKPMNRLADWARGDSFIPGMNKGTAAGLGIGAAGLLAYLMTRDEKKNRKVAANTGGHGIFLPKPTLSQRALTGVGDTINVATDATKSLANRAGAAVKPAWNKTVEIGKASMPYAKGIGLAGTGAYLGASMAGHGHENDVANAVAQAKKDAPIVNPGALGDKASGMWDAVKGWAGKDSVIPGVSNGWAAAGAGTAGLLAYLLTRDKSND